MQKPKAFNNLHEDIYIARRRCNAQKRMSNQILNRKPSKEGILNLGNLGGKIHNSQSLNNKEFGSVTKQKTKNEKEMQDEMDKDQKQSNASNDRERPFCRFCWVQEHTEENPLLATCKCSGGVRFIHFNCLKHWLKTKQQVVSFQNIRTYYWKNFECEICKSPYPYVFKAHGRKYHLIDLPDL